MHTSLDPQKVARALQELASANQQFSAAYPGEPSVRQPVHTVYGGAHLFQPDTARRLGELSRAHLLRYAPDAATFARAFGLPEVLAPSVYQRTLAKLGREAVEDYRLDFEDGYGVRPDPEEDQTALAAAEAVASGLAAQTLPPMLGIRVKPLTEALQARSVRTLDLFVTRLVQKAGRLPDRFVVTLPKVQIPEQVAALVALFEQLELATGLPAGALRLEIMVETPQSLLDRDGRLALPLLVRAAQGRCVAAHLGAYDLTASAQVTAQDQAMDHPLCDEARALMALSLAQTGVCWSDGATNVMPVGPHRGAASALTHEQEDENRAAVHHAWQLQYRHVRHSLRMGFYQGWDLHPGQLPARYAATYAFFLEGLAPTSTRLRNFVDQAARATLSGTTFDDAATGQGLLNYFLRALHCGAIELSELEATGLTREEVASRSFVQILKKRRETC